MPSHLADLGENPRNMRPIAERAVSRAAGAPLIGGNAVRLLVDAEENYEAWLRAIAGAQKTVYFENYIIQPDAMGRRFRDALVAKAKEGVVVRVLQDWLGSLSTGRKFWAPLVEARGRVRSHNPPRIESPLGWLSRDHRKSMVVDGELGYVSGICVSETWLGNPAKGIEPWRDTGIELRGPAASELVTAFAQVWGENGRPVPEIERSAMPHPAAAGQMHVRVIATAPNLAGIYRLDLLVSALAQRRLWLTDAYFAGVPTYVQALRAAARDGVDVRLLVPGGSDLPWLRPLTTAGYRPLLEAGVRVFEWRGSMLHAKTAVADGRWARVGSTNLNLASWLTNYELDVAIEDETFAAEMEALYERDIQHSTEVILRTRKRVRLPCMEDDRATSKPGGGSIARATAGALRVSRAVTAAVTNRRVLGSSENRSVALASVLLAAGAALLLWRPEIAAWPLAALLIWLAMALAIRSARFRKMVRIRERRHKQG